MNEWVDVLGSWVGEWVTGWLRGELVNMGCE